MLFDSIVAFIIVLCIVIAITRGFIKEICALMLSFLSIFLTMDYYDFFTINYSKYFHSQITINILSIISVFTLLNLIFMILNNWIMYILLPIRLGLIDRLSGVMIGTLRGILVSYILFSVINLYCHVIHSEPEEQPVKEKVLPDVIVSSHSYQILFSKIDNTTNRYIPESFVLKIKDIAQKIVQSKSTEQ